MNSSSSVLKTVLSIAVIAFLICVAAIAWWLRRPPTQPDEDGFDSALAARFEMATRAAAFLENIQYEKAIAAYTELRKQAPEETAYLRNAAIAALANAKYQVDLAQDPKNNIDRIRAELPRWFDRTAQAIEEYRKQRPEDPIAYQLDVLRDTRWIAVLAAANPIIADEEQSKLLDKLRAYVERFPENAFLVTQFNNSAEVMSAVDPKILDQTIEPLRRVHQANPRNIYLLCLLIQRLVQAKDASVLELVEPLATLLEPFEWKWKMERRPKDLGDLRRAVEVGKTDLDAALGIIIGWVGEAKFTEGSLVDAKSIDISELAFIDLSDIARMLGQRKSVLSEAEKPTWTTVPLKVPDAIGVRWFDWNVDTRAELLVWTEGQLRLGSVGQAGSWNELAVLDLPFRVRGVVPVDLFSVDAHRGLAARSDIDLADRDAQIAASMRHETVRDLILFGQTGIRVVTFVPPLEDQPHMSLLDEDFGLSDLVDVTAVVPIDWESDGDLDLAIVADGRLYLRENMGNRKFRAVDDVSTLPNADQRVTAIRAVDFDRDVDLDLLLAFESGFGVMENIQHGQFRFRELDGNWSSLASARSLAIGDFQNHFSWDVVGGAMLNANETAMPTGIRCVSTATEPGRAVSAPMSQTLEGDGGIVMTADWNNDARLDIVEASMQGVALWLNRGGRAFDKIPLLRSESPTSAELTAAEVPIAIGDPQSDGWLEIAAIVDGQVTILVPTPQPDHQFLVYRVKGISDANGGGRNNQYAVGSTVEIFGPFGYQVRIIEDDSVHFGLGPHSAFSLRLIFVNGLTQGVIDPTSNTILEEKQVLIGSCPFLYGWDGQRWQLVTDLLWNAPLGLQVAKGRVLPDRRWEYLMIPGKWMQPHDGAYELRVTEELWESAYFDHVALMSVDHPMDVEVLSNEKVGPPSIAEPKLWTYEQTVAPKSVVDGNGRDWMDAIREADGVYATPFRKRFKQGLVETSSLEIDFGSIDTSQSAQLILHGWIQPTDTSLNIGIDQNPNLDPPAPPQLLVMGTSGEFETAIPFTGFPGGKPKTIVIPLDGIFPTEDHRIRIEHSSQIFWDRIRLGYGNAIGIDPANAGVALPTADSQFVRAQWLPLQTGSLHYRGFSREMPRRWYEPHWYDYGTVSTEPAWPPLKGSFTQYGDVIDWIRSNDDRLVVMGAGDEMVLRFEPPDSPIPEGWVRDFVLHSVGWDKDAALNTLEGQSSLPLPFSRMRQYPPGAEDRQEAARIDDLHSESLSRRQDMDRFWKRRPAEEETTRSDDR